MATNLNCRFVELFSVTELVDPAVPSSMAPKYVSMKHLNRLTLQIHAKNGGTPVAAAVTLVQAKTVAGGSEKALPFTRAYRTLDAQATDLITEFAVLANSFSTDDTASKNNIYWIDIRPEDLDINNGFDCVSVDIANATGVTVSILAIGLRKAAGLPMTESMLTD